MDTYARAVVERFLREQGCVPMGVINNRSVWMKDQSLVIQIPMTGRIDYDQFETIATEQLEVGFHEFDYWLGKNT
ncbi:MAG: hypothetical protein WDN75_16000 [Bacteroidota bacterium]